MLTALVEAAHGAGYRLAILSNELDLFYGVALRQRLKCLSRFELSVDATYTGCLKPDPQTYALCLQQLQLPAAQCVFVDDQQRNIDGARAAGLRTVWIDVQRPQAACDEAAHRLGLPGWPDRAQRR